MAKMRSIPERDAHARDLSLWREHVDEVVVSSTGCDGSNTNSGIVGAVLIGVSGLAALLLRRLGVWFGVVGSYLRAEPSVMTS